MQRTPEGSLWLHQVLQAMKLNWYDISKFSITAKSSHDLLRPPAHICTELVRQSLVNVRHLSLRESSDYLENFLEMMPNLTSIYLTCASEHAHSLIESLISSKTMRMLTKITLAASIRDYSVIRLVENFSENLRDLEINCYELKDMSYAAICTCSKLRKLTLLNASFFDDSHTRILALSSPDLEALHIENSELLTQESLRYICGFRKLRELRLLGCFSMEFSGESLNSLRQIVTLRHLHLSFHESISLPMTTFRQLRALKISQQDILPVDLDLIIENCRNLEIFAIRGGKLTDEDGAKLHLLKNVKSLYLSEIDGFSDQTFEKGLGSSDMETLILDAMLLTDYGIAKIAAHHGRLRHLELISCKQVTNGALVSLLQREHCLRALYLVSCSFSDEILEALRDLCPHLNLLMGMACQFSPKGSKQFRKQRPSVYTYFSVGPLLKWDQHRHFRSCDEDGDYDHPVDHLIDNF